LKFSRTSQLRPGESSGIKLPGALKQQLEEDAKQMGMSLHAFMVSTLADAAQRQCAASAFRSTKNPQT